jgi:hypothetical protein
VRKPNPNQTFYDCRFEGETPLGVRNLDLCGRWLRSQNIEYKSIHANADGTLRLGEGCERMAARCTVYKSGVDNHGGGATRLITGNMGPDGTFCMSFGPTRMCSTFDDPTAARDLVLALAIAKGLSRLGEAQADLFFHGWRDVDRMS